MVMLRNTDLAHDIENDQGRELHDWRRSRGKTTVETVTVVQTNGNGFKVADGRWLNASKFALPSAVIMPAVGDTVKVLLDSAGYIRQLAVVEAPPPPVVASAPAPVAEPVAPANVAPRLEQDVRGTMITRMNVLSTATAILSSGGQAAQAWEVINVAELLETWVTRG